jgi:hypothetical protein
MSPKKGHFGPTLEVIIVMGLFRALFLCFRKKKKKKKTTQVGTIKTIMRLQLHKYY